MVLSVDDFIGKVALVTGAGSGIGAACARALGEAGAMVVVADIDAAAAASVADEIGGSAAAVDVANADAVDALVAELDGLHLAVNNAGVPGPLLPIGMVEDAAWRRVQSINVDGVFHCLRAEVKAMRKQGTGGAIVNMASMLGLVGQAGAGAYVTAKHGVVGITKAAALEYAPLGIRVNSVAPGFIKTPLLDGQADGELTARLVAQTPLGRLGTADEVAASVTWLLSDAASFVTGACIPVDGGFTTG